MTADATAAAAALPVHTGTFAALRYGGYRRLLLGTTLANGGQWLQQVTVSWLAYDITGSGTSVGTVNLFRSFATLGSAPWAGLAVDRVSPRRLIIAINLWLAILSAVVGAFLMGGERHLWLLFAFAFGSGIATAVDQPLRQAAVFLLVPRPVAPNAVALMQTGWGLMRSVGPAIGGLLIALVGPGGNFLLQSAVYGLILLNGLTIAFPPRGGTRAAPSFLRNLAEGIRYVKGAAETRTFVMMGWILPLLIIPTFTALPPIYAKEVFHGGSLTLGLLLSAVGVGAIVGGLFAASLNSIDRRGVVQLVALFFLSLSLCGFALSTHLVPALAMLVLSGFCEMIYLTSNQTLLQLSIPDDLRGRVTSIVSLNMGLSPLGALYAGAGSDWIGPANITLVLSGLAGLLAVLILLFSRTVRDYRISRAMASH